jgi:hypothetical protein
VWHFGTARDHAKDITGIGLVSYLRRQGIIIAPVVIRRGWKDWCDSAIEVAVMTRYIAMKMM